MDNKITNRINEYMEEYTKLWAFSGSIAAIKDGNVIFKKAYGKASIEHNIQNTPKTKHRVWSITKQFTAAAILILEERGLLKVEDSLTKYFQEYTDLDPRITIHHLLTHTSGIFNYSNLPNSHENFQRLSHKKSDLIKMFTSKPLDFEPGTNWNYSNTGYYLLGVLMEKISNKSYSNFLKENIFNPLKMHNTGLDDEKTIVDNKATGYYLNDNDIINSKYISMDLIFSSGAMYSTVEDLLLWDQALKSEKILSTNSIKKMNTPYLNNYGYGVKVEINNNKTDINHNGGCEGFLADFHRYIEDDFTVVVLSNYGFSAVSKICNIITSIAFNEEYELPKKPKLYKLSEENMNSYLGIYETQGIKLEIINDNSGTSLIINNEFNLQVYPISQDTFHHTWIDEEYTITKNENGELSLWGINKVTNKCK